MNFLLICYSSIILNILVVAIPSYSFPSTNRIQKNAVEKLITRLIGPTKSALFAVEISNQTSNQSTDSFSLIKLDSNLVRITGTSGVAAAYGFHFYLKNFCNCHVSWDHDQLNLPLQLPYVNITVTSPDRFRYYQNVCTYSYSYVWWNWLRWEREIDWMALNGINLALAFTAQEVIWSRVFQRFNLTDRDIDEHFTGPAFLAWGRMANIRGWGGPLFEGWHEDQLTLQHRILRRMREIGISPILPAFCGHVPRAFRRIFPNAKLTSLSTWSNFPAEYCCPYIMEPEEPMFAQVGKVFYEIMENEFGSTHFYNCDIFNELKPPNSSLLYLKNIASKVSTVLLTSDPAAVWIMQGWLFANDAEFWSLERVRHFLSGVPNDKMIILDLQSELRPLYVPLQFYFGKPFIWCMLHNFGGTLGMHGSLDTINKNVIQARALENSTMIGTGITPEGINQNYVVYDFMSEVGWRNTTVNVDSWIEKYSNRRYIVANSKNLEKAWKLLRRSVYNYKLSYPLHGQYTFVRRPSTRYAPWVWYNVSDIATAWDLMTTAEHELCSDLNYRHDLTDLTRQALQIVFDHWYRELVRSYHQKKLSMLQYSSKILLNLLSDLENILATNHRFMLGPWIQEAGLKGRLMSEKKLLELNARYQITLWGPKGEVLDYAGKQWSGLVEDYYRPRWKLFTEFLNKSLAEKTPFQQHVFDATVLALVELPFVNIAKNYPKYPKNDTCIVAKYCHGKWRRYLKLI